MSIGNMVLRDDYSVGIKLTDVYCSIPVAEVNGRYLRFYVGYLLPSYKVLCFVWQVPPALLRHA